MNLKSLKPIDKVSPVSAPCNKMRASEESETEPQLSTAEPPSHAVAAEKQTSSDVSQLGGSQLSQNSSAIYSDEKRSATELPSVSNSERKSQVGVPFSTPSMKKKDEDAPGTSYSSDFSKAHASVDVTSFEQSLYKYYPGKIIYKKKLPKEPIMSVISSRVYRASVLKKVAKEADDWICCYCKVTYSEDQETNRDVGWIECDKCKSQMHNKCIHQTHLNATGYEPNDETDDIEFKCEVCF